MSVSQFWQGKTIKQVTVADASLYDQDEEHKIRALFLGSLLELLSVKENPLKKKITLAWFSASQRACFKFTLRK